MTHTQPCGLRAAREEPDDLFEDQRLSFRFDLHRQRVVVERGARVVGFRGSETPRGRHVGGSSPRVRGL